MNTVARRNYTAWAVAIGATATPAVWLVAVAARYVLSAEPMTPRTILTSLPYTSSLLGALFVGMLVASGLVLREKPRAAALLGGVMMLAVALSEGQAIRNRRDLSRLSLSMRLVLQAGQFVHAEFVGMGKAFPSATPASVRNMRDAWGRPLAYRQISPSAAFVGSPEIPVASSAEPSQFPPSDFRHAVVVRIDQLGPAFVIYPYGSASGDSCYLESVFGCFGYWK